MRSFLIALFGFLFIITIPVFAVLLSLRFTNISAPSVKQSLDDGNVYIRIHETLMSAMDSNVKENPTDNPFTLLSPFIKKQITPQYLQTKTNQALDDTEAWVTGKTPVTPKLSLTDLKTKLLAQNTNIISQLKTFEEEYAKTKQDIPSTEEQTLPDLNISSFLENDPAIDLSQFLFWLKPLYMLAHTGTFILGVLMGLYAVSIGLLSRPLNRKLRNLSLLLLLSAGWNYFLYIGVIRYLPEISRYLPKEVNYFSFLSQYSSVITNPFLESLTRISPYITLSFLCIGVALMTAGMITAPPSFPTPMLIVLIFIGAVFTGFAAYRLMVLYPKTFTRKTITYVQQNIDESQMKAENSKPTAVPTKYKPPVKKIIPTPTDEPVHEEIPIPDEDVGL